MKEEIERKKVATIFGLIAVLIIFMWAYNHIPGDLFNKITTKPVFEVPLFEEDIPNLYQIDDEIEYNLYVPNYNADIFIILNKKELKKGDSVGIDIRIKDKGIVNLENPYFYLFLLNPKDEVVGVFPEGSKVRASSDTRGSHKFHDYSEQGWDKWELEDHHEKYYVDSMPLEIEKNKYYLPRDTLYTGEGKYVYTLGNYLYWTDEIYRARYSYKIKETDLVGEWKLYVFLFDEAYYDRFNEIIPEDVLKSNYLNFDMKNAVNYAKASINITDKPIEETKFIILKILKFLAVAIASFGAYTGIYRLVDNKYIKILNIWKTIKKDKFYFIGFFFLIISFILFFLYFIRS